MSTAVSSGVFRQDATVIGLVGFAHATSHFFHLMLPPLFPWLMTEYSLSFTQVGALMSVFFAVSGIGQALAGFLVDRWGAHRVLCAGVALLATSGILVAAAPALWGLYVAAFVAGLGNSIFHPADFSLLNHRVSQSRLGHAFSVHGLSGNLGWAAGPIVMTAAASSFGWRTAGVVAALIGFAALSGLWWKRDELSNALVDASRDTGKRARGSDVTVSGLLKLPLVWFAFSFFFLSTLVLAALQNFAPSLMRSLYGLSLAAGTSALTAYLIGGAAGVAMGGFLTGDNRNEERIVGLAFLTSAVLALILAFSLTPRWAVIGVMALMGCGVGLAGPSRDMLVRKCAAARLGTGAFGRIYGLVYSGLDVGLAAGPLVFGMMMDAGKPRLVFIGIGLSFVLATIAAQAMARQVKSPA